MILIKKFVNEAARGFAYAFGYYTMKRLITNADNTVRDAKQKRNIKSRKNRFRIRKKRA